MTYFQVVMVWLKHWHKDMNEAGYDQSWQESDDICSYLATPSDLRLSYRI